MKWVNSPTPARHDTVENFYCIKSSLSPRFDIMVLLNVVLDVFNILIHIPAKFFQFLVDGYYTVKDNFIRFVGDKGWGITTRFSTSSSFCYVGIVLNDTSHILLSRLPVTPSIL